MTRVKPGQRQRSKAAKVRTGCKTCKKRRVKCDEATPVCKNCAARGRPCSYESPLGQAWILADGADVGCFIYTPPASLTLDAREQRSLQFFLEKTIGQLTASFPDKLWNPILLQLAYAEPSIRHALFAFSTYHEQFLNSRRGAERETPYALSQYNRAIHGILDRPHCPSSTHINLTTCLIFVGIETLRYRYSSSHHLFKYGRRILEEWRQANKSGNACVTPGSDSHQIIRLIEAVFDRISIQINQLFEGDGSNPALRVTPDSLSPALFPHLSPSTFASLEEARESLVDILKTFTQTGAPVNREEYHEYLGVLNAWSRAFESFLRQRSDTPLSPIERRAVALLRGHKQHCALMLARSGSPNADSPLFWDSYVDEFDEIVDFAAAALGLDGSDDTHWAQQRESPLQFNLEMGVLSVLHSCFLKCRDPFIRRKILKIMPYAPTHEGVWTGPLTLGVHRKVIEFEEMGLENVQSCHDIPAEARIISVGLYLDPEGKKPAFVHYNTQTSHWQEIVPGTGSEDGFMEF